MSKTYTGEQAFVAFVWAFAVFVLNFLLQVWLFMIVLGATHSHLPVVPALGFTASAWAAVLISIVGQLFWVKPITTS